MLNKKKSVLLDLKKNTLSVWTVRPMITSQPGSWDVILMGIMMRPNASNRCHLSTMITHMDEFFIRPMKTHICPAMSRRCASATNRVKRWVALDTNVLSTEACCPGWQPRPPEHRQFGARVPPWGWHPRGRLLQALRGQACQAQVSMKENHIVFFGVLHLTQESVLIEFYS